MSGQSSGALSSTPAGPAPPGIQPNLTNPPNHLWHYTLATVIGAWCLTIPCTSMRIFTKLYVQRTFQYEDYVISLAQAMFLAQCVPLVVQPSLSRHIWDLSLADLENVLYWGNIVDILYEVALLFTKWALLLQLGRVFVAKKFDRTWWVVQGLIWAATTFYGIFVFTTTFQCIPRSKIWQPDIPGHCNISLPGGFLSSAIFNVIINCSILLIPLFVVGPMQLYRKKKVMIIALFSMMVLALVSSILRVVYGVPFINSTDPTYDESRIVLWSVAEVAFMIFACSFPLFRPFVEYLRTAIDRRRSSRDGDFTMTTLTEQPPRSWMRLTRDWDSREIPEQPNPSAYHGVGHPDNNLDRDDKVIAPISAVAV